VRRDKKEGKVCHVRTDDHDLAAVVEAVHERQQRRDDRGVDLVLREDKVGESRRPTSPSFDRWISMRMYGADRGECGPACCS
jgi:hypothetical protein